MGGLFNLDNPIWRFMGKLADLMLLHLLWFICSIPIVTIGASTTAVYYVTLKLVRDEEGYTAKSFFKSFKENFKQSTIMWLIILAMGIILGIDLKLYLNAIGSGSSLQRIMAILFFSLAVIFVMTVMYVFPLQAKFVNPIKRTFINSFFMAIRHLPYTLLMIAITVFFYAAVLLIPQLSLFLIVFGFTLPAFLNSYFYAKIFDKYIPKEEKKTNDEELSVLFEDDPMPVHGMTASEPASEIAKIAENSENSEEDKTEETAGETTGETTEEKAEDER